MEPGLTTRAQLGQLTAYFLAATDAEEEPLGVGWKFLPRLSRLALSHTFLGDTALAVLVTLVSTSWLFHNNINRPSDWALQAGLVLPLIWRRRHPLAVFAVMAVVALIQWSTGVLLLADMALLPALYTLAAQRSRRLAIGAAGVLELGAVMATLRWNLDGSWIRSLVFLSGLAAAAFLLGANLRSRRSHLASLMEKAERLERERDQQTMLAAAAERTRIAREMHDIIAHSLAVIISLADGANAKMHTDPERANDAIRHVSEIGRQALGDTRRMLGVLRSGHETNSLAPQPGVAQIAELIDQVRATGLSASIVTEGSPRPLAAGTELAAYRIVQEATTNTLKHAVGASKLSVTLDYGREVLSITVADDGRAGRGRETGLVSLPSSGHGLAGMRERAALYQGTVVAGPLARGWSVRAQLPITPEPSSLMKPLTPSGPGR